MGVSGSGKTTVGRALARRMGLPFHDADTFHPQANVAKMRRGEPLTDQDRRPWLQTLADHIGHWEERGGAVLACSALKHKYRALLRQGALGSVRFVYLRGDEQTLESRLRSREGHFFPAGLLPTQLRALEEPSDAVTVDIREPVEVIVERIAAACSPEHPGEPG